MSFPLTFGVVGAVFLPVPAAVGALAALVNDCSISVEVDEKTKGSSTAEPMVHEKPMD
jgi:hypothetical protein